MPGRGPNTAHYLDPEWVDMLNYGETCFPFLALHVVDSNSGTIQAARDVG